MKEKNRDSKNCAGVIRWPKLQRSSGSAKAMETATNSSCRSHFHLKLGSGQFLISDIDKLGMAVLRKLSEYASTRRSSLQEAQAGGNIQQHHRDYRECFDLHNQCSSRFNLSLERCGKQPAIDKAPQKPDECSLIGDEPPISRPRPSTRP